MPQFSVTLEEINPPNPDWHTTVLRVNAVSAKHAMKKAESKLWNLPQRYAAKSARRYKTDHKFWYKIWRRAYNNMPTRIYVQKHELWQAKEPGSVTLPEFIKESAHGNMKHGENGLVQKKITKRRAYKMGATAALTRLLGYCKSSERGGHRNLGHLCVLSAMARGSRPKTEERRKLLLRLSGPDGTRIAAKLLGRRFQPLKIKGKKK